MRFAVISGFRYEPHMFMWFETKEEAQSYFNEEKKYRPKDNCFLVELIDSHDVPEDPFE